jgi:hypothetical protein
MPITVEWANSEKTVLKWTISGNFTGQDVVDAMEAYAKLADTAEQGFYMLLDFTESASSAIPALSRLPEVAHSLPKRRADAIIAVGHSQTVSMVTGIFSKVYGGKFEYLTSMDKAKEYLMTVFGAEID